MEISYWSDYACPFCYIGVAHLRKALENLGLREQVPIRMLAFELDPDAPGQVTGPTVDRFARKYGLSLAQAQKRIDDISRMGREAGLDLHYADTRYTNTFDAHRLTKLAQESDATLAARLEERFYRAYFTEGLELADPEVLRRIAMEEGMEEKEVEEVLASDRFAAEVRLDERSARRYEIHAVPSFLIGQKKVITGALSVEEMQRLLKQAWEEEAKEEGGEVQGQSCGLDGCRLDER